MSPAPVPPDEFLTSEELIETLQRDPHLRRLALTCVLPAVKVGDEWRFRRSDFDEWLAKHQP